MESNEPVKNRKLFIGGLNAYTTTEDSLKIFFQQWGEVEDVVVVKDCQTKLSRGFGFVTYAQSFMVEKAMKNQPHIIDDREVDTKRVVAWKDIDKPANVLRIFISNIREQSEYDLIEYFGKYGSIINTKIVIDKNSVQRKGTAFIEYDDANSVDKAIFMKSHYVAGGELFLQKLISRTNSNGLGGRSNRGANNCCRNKSYGGGGPIKTNYTSNYRATPYGNPGAGNVNTGNYSDGQNPGGQHSHMTYN